MNAKNRIGGIAALAAAATFVVGIVMFATMLSDYTTGDPTSAESVAFVTANQSALHVWYIVTLIVFGAALVPLVIALHERFGGFGRVRVASSFGLIWAGLVLATGMIANVGVGTVADVAERDAAQAAAVWAALDAVQNGMGGGNEVVGGLWVLLISWAGLAKRVLPRALNYLGIASGVAGLITVVPSLEATGMVFGLGLIVWFTWLGIVLLRGAVDASTSSSALFAERDGTAETGPLMDQMTH